VIESCTILTTTPNFLVSDIHDRMPVILNSESYDLWLDPAFRDTTSVSEMLRALRCCPDEALSREHESQSCGE